MTKAADTAEYARSMSSRLTPLCSQKTRIKLQPAKNKTERQQRKRRQSPSEDGSYVATAGGGGGTVLLLFCHRLIKERLNSEIDLTIVSVSRYFHQTSDAGRRRTSSPLLLLSALVLSEIKKTKTNCSSPPKHFYIP